MRRRAGRSEAIAGDSVAAIQYRSTGSTSSDHRTRRACGEAYSNGTSASSSACRRRRSPDDNNSCARWKPARRGIGAGSGPCRCTSASGAMSPSRVLAAVQERGRRVHRFRFRAQQGQVCEWWKAGGLAQRQFGLGEGVVTALDQGVQQWMLRDGVSAAAPHPGARRGRRGRRPGSATARVSRWRGNRRKTSLRRSRPPRPASGSAGRGPWPASACRPGSRAAFRASPAARPVRRAGACCRDPRAAPAPPGIVRTATLRVVRCRSPAAAAQAHRNPGRPAEPDAWRRSDGIAGADRRRARSSTHRSAGIARSSRSRGTAAPVRSRGGS